MSDFLDYTPPLGFHFSVEFDLPGTTDYDVKFREVSGIEREMEVLTHIEGGENRFTHKLPVRGIYPNLILKRGMMVDTALRRWCHDAIYEMQIDPVTVWVKVLNEKHQPLKTITFHNAWPRKWSISDLNSEANAIVVESLELCYQYFNIEE